MSSTSPQPPDDGIPRPPEVVRRLALLWDPPQPSGRGRKARLTLEDVVGAGTAIADADGLDALSMRRVAGHLGVGAMSLYTYVPGKAELFELMIDRAHGERELPDEGLGWRLRYAGHAREALAMYRRHPWLVHANLWRLPLGPHVLDVNEDMLRVGAAAGLPPLQRVRVASLLESYIFGIARGEIADRSEVLRTGVSRDDYWEARAAFWNTYFDPKRYPAMLATWEAGGFEQDSTPDDDLAFALDLILDSVERLVRSAHG
jgi:AcrR family transcriptional regulator